MASTTRHTPVRPGAAKPRLAHRRDRAVNSLAGLLLVGGASMAVFAGPDAQAGPDHSDPGPSYPAGASVTTFAGKAFDTCETPSLKAMDAWQDSPYRGVGIYLSGRNRLCAAQPNLTPNWVRSTTSVGWHLIPIDVGLQAPCRDNRKKKPMHAKHAEAEGTAAAAGAVSAARTLGILPGSALYADIESYDPTVPNCARTVATYLSGWTQELHRRGYLGGMYGTGRSGVGDAAARYAEVDLTRPDAVWLARWDRARSLTGWSGVPDAAWSNHQRMKQYRGDHIERYGGVALNVDSSQVDAPVATVAHSFPITAADTAAHRSPDIAAARVGTLATGATANVICQVRSLGRPIWDKLDDGTYLDDTRVAGGSTKDLPECSYASPVASGTGAVIRSGPGPGYDTGGTLPLGALARVTCRDLAQSWVRLDHNWVAAADLAGGGPGSAATPYCPPTSAAASRPGE
ncbi:MAG TPA: DUF1906 domain-containing protein [Sporichthyaceae bacterium]|jgi:hypothetical protein